MVQGDQRRELYHPSLRRCVWVQLSPNHKLPVFIDSLSSAYCGHLTEFQWSLSTANFPFSHDKTVKCGAHISSVKKSPVPHFTHC